MMVASGANCLVTLGGDGTNRMVAKASGAVPIMPISTGTNNVFPVMIEGTIAGLAAGLVAVGAANAAVFRAPRIDVWQAGNEAVQDLALVDAVVYAEQFIASRAIWDEAKIREIILTRPNRATLVSPRLALICWLAIIQRIMGCISKLGLAGAPSLRPLPPVCCAQSVWQNIAFWLPAKKLY